MVKNLPANAGDVRDASLIPGSGRTPGGGITTHSSILAWRISWAEELGGLWSIGLDKELDTTEATEHTQHPGFWLMLDTDCGAINWLARHLRIKSFVGNVSSLDMFEMSARTFWWRCQ